jgi:hypothetical protein
MLCYLAIRAKIMKTKEIYKANGRTFNSFAEVEKYATENGYRITNTETIRYKGNTIYLIDLKSI